MLGKEQIEKAKEKLNKFCKYEDNLFLQDEVLCEYQDAIETLLQYIDQLEQENNKLNKINDLMAKEISAEILTKEQWCPLLSKERGCYKNDTCLKCLKKYLEKKVENKNE